MVESSQAQPGAVAPPNGAGASNQVQKYELALRALEEGLPAAEAAVERTLPEGAPAHPSVVALLERSRDALLFWEVVAGDEYVVFVRPERCFELLRWLKEEPSQAYLYLSDVTAVDYGGGRPLQVVYQLWSMVLKRQLRVKAELPLSALEIDSVVPIWNAANWLEREVYDLFGIRFLGHPDLRRIMMPNNYAEGHPLRKDFPLRGRFSRAEQTRRALSMDTEDFYSPQELVFMQPEDEVGPPGPDSGPGAGGPAEPEGDRA
jgi:NADH-quinone oxidoreductase subunit C